MKHEIEIEGLPEGWEAVAFRKPKEDEYIFCNDTGCVVHSIQRIPALRLIVKKKQPRRIVLEETDEENYRYVSGQYKSYNAGEFILSGTRYVWREVKGTDLSLTNVDDKESLRLSVDDARELVRLIDTGLVKKTVSNKIRNFLKDK